MELWRDIPEYEGLYQVSTLGRVRSLDRVATDSCGRMQTCQGRVLRPARYGGGLKWWVCLCVAGKKRSVAISRLVAAAWIGPCPDGYSVRYKTNDRMNDSLSNLFYGPGSGIGSDMRREYV